jgi:predicted RND superfamily exporter protein
MMKNFAVLVLKYRVAVVVITIGLTIFFGYGASKITLNTDMLSYLRQNDAVRLFNRIGNDYGGNTVAMVGIGADNIFTTETLTTIRDLTEAYKQIPGVATVMSLTNVLDMQAIEGGVEVRKLIDKYAIPQTPEDLERLRTYTLGKEMYVGKFISTDGKITLLIARLQPDADKATVAAKIHALTEARKGTHTIYYSGLPLQMLEMGVLLIQDLVYLIPLVIVLVVGTLYASFKSVRGVVLPLVNVLIATLWAVGLMGWLHVDMSLISNIMPIILIAIGSAYSIHLLAKYYEDIHPGAEKHAVVAEALAKVGIPIIMAGLTTLVGFLSNVGSYLTAVTHFGLFSAFGVTIAMLLALTFIPALLSWLPAPRITAHDVQQERHFLVHALDRVGEVVLQHEKLILGIAGVLALVSFTGLPRLTTEANFVEFFPPQSQMRLTDTLMREKFGGSTPIQMLITGDLKDPWVLKEMIRLEKYMASLPDVNNTQSLADLICEMNDVMNDHATIPETTEQVANLLFMLEGEDILAQLVNKDYSEGIIQARFGTANSEKTAQAVKTINAYLATELDTRLRVVTISEVPAAQQAQLQDFRNTRIREAILSDARERMPAAQVDGERLAAQLRQFTTTAFVPLDAAHQDALRSRLEAFFAEESDITLDSEEQITQVNAAIVQYTATQAVNAESLIPLLQAQLPRETWEADPTVLEDLADSLLVILQERQEVNRIASFAQALLPLFPPELQGKEAFLDDLRDDLWELNQRQTAIPAALPIAPGGPEIALRATQSGMMFIMNEILQSLVASQLMSLVLALVAVVILLSVQFKSVKLGLVVTSPIMLTVLINFAVMAYAGTPLEMGTIMIASVAIGIGIDYAIHFSSRLQHEMRRQPDELFAIDRTLETTGRAILINAFTVALGFIILVFSKIIEIQRFGWLMALTMGVSSCAAITFLPALILVLRRGLFPQRQYPRLTAPITYRAAADRTASHPIINVSLGGLRIHRTEKWKRRERFALELVLPDQTVLACQVQVVWQRPLPDDADAKYDVGLRFVNVPDEQLARLAGVLRVYGQPTAS